MSVISTASRCRLCGSSYCGIFQCRFYRDAEHARQEQEEFRKQWESTTSDIKEEDLGYQR